MAQAPQPDDIDQAILDALSDGEDDAQTTSPYTSGHPRAARTRPAGLVGAASL